VTEADLGVNFFLDESYLGQRRSRGLTELLTELNPEVKGSWYPNEVGLPEYVSAQSRGQLLISRV
jgi:hypothetical protein